SQLSPRKDSRVARFHVENLDPTCPEIRQVVGESDIDHDQENVMERIQQRQLRDYAFGIRKQEIGYDGNERRSAEMGRDRGSEIPCCWRGLPGSVRPIPFGGVDHVGSPDPRSHSRNLAEALAEGE